MVYLRNQPVPTDDLSISAPLLAGNTNSADDSFGVDHYKFSDLTANNGFHNTVTTPLIVGGIHPTTTAVLDKFYAMEDTPNVGILQYSRGWNIASSAPAVPTPITNLQSPSSAIILAPGATTNVLDCTGLPRLIGTLYAFDSLVMTNVAAPSIFWNGTVFQIGASGNLKVQSTGNIIQLKNNSASTMNVYWTFELQRLQ